MKNKKHEQLGMNSATASNRLIKDTLFRLAVESGHLCYRCNKPLQRETFSVEHKEPWLNSENPKEKFFDQTNIAFSHIHCNVGAARKLNKIYENEEQRSIAHRPRRAKHMRDVYTTEARREKYRRTGY